MTALNVATLVILVTAMVMMILGSMVFRRQYNVSRQTDHIDHHARQLAIAMAAWAALFSLASILYFILAM